MPMFWLMLWGLALAGLGGLFFAAFWLQFRLRRMARRNLELESRADSSEKALEAASLVDPLTGLHNRRFLDIYLPLDAQAALRAFRELLDTGGDTVGSREDVLLCVLGLDQFEQVNGTWGRPAGDAVLAQVARALESATRKTDYRIRWEGDTFVVVARRARRTEAPTVARNLLALVRELTFRLPDGTQLRRQASIGYAALPLHPNHPELGGWQAALGMAEQCLQAAKRTGRDRWVGVMVDPDADPGRFEGPGAWDVTAALDQGLVRVKSSEPTFAWPGLRALDGHT